LKRPAKTARVEAFLRSRIPTSPLWPTSCGTLLPSAEQRITLLGGLLNVLPVEEEVIPVDAASFEDRHGLLPCVGNNISRHCSMSLNLCPIGIASSTAEVPLPRLRRLRLADHVGFLHRLVRGGFGRSSRLAKDLKRIGVDGRGQRAKDSRRR
jgi:hypothetical protein